MFTMFLGRTESLMDVNTRIQSTVYAMPPAPKVFGSGAIKDNIAYNCVISGICIALKGKAVHFVNPLKCSGIRW